MLPKTSNGIGMCRCIGQQLALYDLDCDTEAGGGGSIDPSTSSSQAGRICAWPPEVAHFSYSSKSRAKQRACHPRAPLPIAVCPPTLGRRDKFWCFTGLQVPVTEPWQLSCWVPLQRENARHGRHILAEISVGVCGAHCALVSLRRLSCLAALQKGCLA